MLFGKSLVTVAGLAPAYVELEVVFWIDTFSERGNLPQVRSAVMDRCRLALREGGFTLSNDAATSIALTPRPLGVRLADADPQTKKGAEHGLG